MKTKILKKCLIGFCGVLLLLSQGCEDENISTATLDSGIDVLDFGIVEREEISTKSLAISSELLFEDLAIEISGEGYSVDKTAIPPGETSAEINVSYLASLEQEEGLKFGELIISSGELADTIILQASLGEPLDGELGFYIVNEGSWGNGDASLSYFNKVANRLTNNLFSTVNDFPLGDQAQSMTVHNDKGYIVVQNSGKIEVIDIFDNTWLATIETDISSPRYFLGISETKGYVTDWVDGFNGVVQVIDLLTNTITKSIECGQGPNQMVISGNNVYVANAGGWGSDNTIKVIDVTTDQVIKTITVGDNPKSVVVDDNGVIWVVGSGKIAYDVNWNVDLENSTPGFIAKIVNDEVEVLFEMENKNAGPSKLVMDVDSGNLYIDYDTGIYKIVANDVSNANTTIDLQLFVEKSFYGMIWDTSDDQFIGFEAPNFTSAGTMYRYDNTGTLVDEHTTGIAPNGAAY